MFDKEVPELEIGVKTIFRTIWICGLGSACVLIAGQLALRATGSRRRLGRGTVWGLTALVLLIGLGSLARLAGLDDGAAADSMAAVVALGVVAALFLESRSAPASAMDDSGKLLEALRLSQRQASRLQLFASRTDNGMLMTDARRRIEWVNEGFTRITGFSFEEALRRTPDALLYGPETDPGALAFIDQKLRAGEGVRTELLRYAKSGRKLWLAVEIQPIFDDGGRIVNYLEVQTDVTERKRAERRMEVQYTVMGILSSCARLEEAVPHLTAAIGRTLDFDIAEFWSWDHQAEALRLIDKPWTSPRVPPVWAAETETLLHRSRLADIPDRVWSSGSPAWIPDLAQPDAGSLNRGELAARCGLRGAVMVPVSLREAGPVAGALVFFSRETLSHDEPLSKTLTTLGRQIGLFAERKRAVSALIEVNSRLNAVLDASTQSSIIATDPQGVITVFNIGAERMLGYSAAEMVGKTTALALHDPAEVAEHAATLAAEMNEPVHQGVEALTARARLGGHDVREWTYIRKDGSRLPVLLAVTAVRDPAGWINGFLGVATDLTAWRTAEGRVLKSEARLRRLVEANIFGVLFGDLTGRVADANDALLAMIGHTRDELKRGELRWGEAVAPSSRRLIAKCRARLERDGHCEPFEIELRRKDGRNMPILLGLALLDETRPLDRDSRVVAFCLDLTERKRLENELRRHADELAEADHRKNQFLAMLGHELRNPLAPIRNAVNVMERLGSADPRLVWARSVIDQQVRQLAHLVNDLLEIARITRGKIRLQPEVVDAADVIARAVETSRPEIEAHGHRFSINLPPRSTLMMADPIRLAQVLSNLLHNAAKYTKNGGHIELSAAVEGDQVVFRVKDDGIGIPGPMLARIFDLFTQVDPDLDRSQGGLGLGLTLVQALVEMHEGTVEAHSDGHNQGSEFLVRLPLHRPAETSPTIEAPDEPTAAEAHAAPPPRGRRVLVVDDNVASAQSMAMLLGFEGHETRIVHDGPSVLEALDGGAGEGFDVILMDIGLPGMDGYEVARRLRARPEFANLPLAAVTGYAEDDARTRSREAGFNHHFVKPVDPEALLAFVASLGQTAEDVPATAALD